MGCSNSVQHSAENDLSKDWHLLHKIGEGSYATVDAVKHKRSSHNAAIKKSEAGIDVSEHLREVEIWKKISTRNDFSKDWHLLHKIGEGSYATVYAVKHKRSSHIAATKIPKADIDVSEHLREVEIWKKVCRHEHIVGFIDAYTIAGVSVVLMEKCGLALSTCIHDMSMAGEASMAHLFYQMTTSLAYLHSLHIVHRDVKLDNYLFTGRTDQTLKLCDLGFAKIVPPSGKLFGTYGTPFFMSPEMVGSGSHNLATDVWSLGVSWYLMLYGGYPYTSAPITAKNVMRTIAEGRPEPTYQGRGRTSCAAKQAVSALLHRPQSTRISAEQVLELPFLELDSEQLVLKTSIESSMLVEIGSQQSTRDEGSALASRSSSNFVDTREIVSL